MLFIEYSDLEEIRGKTKESGAREAGEIDEVEGEENDRDIN